MPVGCVVLYLGWPIGCGIGLGATQALRVAWGGSGVVCDILLRQLYREHLQIEGEMKFDDLKPYLGPFHMRWASPVCQDSPLLLDPTIITIFLE